MVDFEAQVNGGNHRQGPVSGFAGQAANVIGDVLELAELQARLAKTDAVEAANRAAKPLALIVIGGSTAVAGLPVITFGMASLIDETTVLNAWQSQLLTGGVVTLVALLVVYLAIRRLLNASQQFKRSAEELAKNMAWAKAVVRSQPAENVSRI